MTAVAHRVSEKRRTNDVLISENVSFSSLLLSDKVLSGLKNSGFIKPSPIQLKAIPLGRCGLDLIVQAKSGTGKTCVFSVIALESICIDSGSTQVLVLAPTREIAVQIWEVIRSIGSAMKGLECHTFIGGLPLHEDRMKLKKCHIAVGSPGRIKQLIETGVLRTENIRMFVLDEADKLLEEGFQDQINWIYSTLPENKQMLALSATYPEYLADHLTAYMRNPTFLRLNISDPALLGIRQYYQSVTYHPLSHVVFEEKCKVLINILSSVSFQQCLVFSNIQTRASNLADTLTNKGWPTACIAGCLDQKDRNHAMAKLKTYKCRILISTDLTARGIDADKVNLVVNMDMPKDHETYLHRIGRAGRFGSFGIAVSLVSDGQEKMDMNSIEKRCNTTIHPLPDPLPADLAKTEEPVYLNDVVSSEVIHTNTKQSKHSKPPDATGDNTTRTPNNVNASEDGSNIEKTLLNGDHKVEVTENKVKNQLNDGNGQTSTKQNGLSNGIWGGCEDLEDGPETADEGRELTVYDLPDDPRNGLHFLEDTSSIVITQDRERKEKKCVKVEDTFEAKQDKVKAPHGVADDLFNIKYKEKEPDPLKLEEPSEAKSAIISTTKTSETKSTDKDISKSKGKLQAGKSESQPVYTIPRYTELNLSAVFKNTIGYKKQEKTLSYISGQESLENFRNNFSGYRESAPMTLPEISKDENSELLKKAVCQLQELFDRNIQINVEPGQPKEELKACAMKQDLVKHEYDVTDLQHKQSQEVVDKSESTLVNGDKVNILVETSKTELRKDEMFVSEVKSEAGETQTPDTDVGVRNGAVNDRKTAKDVENKGAIPKQNRPRKHYTNKFAIGYLLEPGGSVFNEETENGNDTVPEEKVQTQKVKDSNQHQELLQENTVTQRVEPDAAFIPENKDFSDYSPAERSVKEVEMQVRKPVSRKPSQPSSKYDNTNNHNSRLNNGTKHGSNSSSKTTDKTEYKSRRSEQYTSDSDSDSTTDSSTDSEDERQNHHYTSRYNHSYSDDQYKQSYNDRQYNQPMSSQYKQRYPQPYTYPPYGQPFPGQYPHQQMPQQYSYQQPVYGYQHPMYQSPWLGHSGVYGNMPGHMDAKSINQQIKSHMEQSRQVQQDYIKAMSRSVSEGQKRSKKKTKKSK